MLTNRISAGALREQRITRGLSCSQLADKSGVDISVIYKLENGKTTRPRMDTLRMLAEALGVEVIDLMARDEVTV